MLFDHASSFFFLAKIAMKTRVLRFFFFQRINLKFSCISKREKRSMKISFVATLKILYVFVRLCSTKTCNAFKIDHVLDDNSNERYYEDICASKWIICACDCVEIIFAIFATIIVMYCFNNKACICNAITVFMLQPFPPQSGPVASTSRWEGDSPGNSLKTR